MVGSEKIGMKRNEIMQTVDEIKQDFPFFNKNQNVTFLDSAASSLTPFSVIEAIKKYYEKYSVNIHRGVYDASMKATEIYENTREKINAFLNANNEGDIIYVRNATEAFNMIAHCLSEEFSEGDVILLSESEHHANIVPWQMAMKRCSLQIEYLPIHKKNGMFNMESFDAMKKKLQNRRLKVISLAQTSNVTGVSHDLTPFWDYAREKGAFFIVDGAQSVCHTKIDLKKLSPDFFIFSGHKMLGPTGIGILWGKKELTKRLPPFLGGGDMILSVSKEKIVYNLSPHKFEAGTPNISGVFGLGAAVDYLNGFDRDVLEQREKSLTLYAMKQMNDVGCDVHGPSLEEVQQGDVQKIGVISFNVGSVHPHDVGTILNQDGIAIRVGHHCCQILMSVWGVSATCRASLYLYNDKQDINRLIEGISKVKEIFLKGSG